MCWNSKHKPKFEIGDWIVTPENKVLHITSIVGTKYRFNNESHYWETYYCDKRCHIWTIADAKDGDVLVSPATQEGDKECPFIFKEIDKNGIVRFHIALLQSETIKIADGITNVMGYANVGYHTPATKEQRDTFFAKMKEVGYEWNDEQKHLIMLDHFVDYNDMVETKFNVGDKIIEKDFDECGCGTIIDIKDGKYIFDDGNFIWIKEQDLWELVDKKCSDKVETKFKVGDWIVCCDYEPVQIIGIRMNAYYEMSDGDSRPIYMVDNNPNIRLWTIQDAKDGDIIYAESRDDTLDFVCIFSKLENEKSWVYCSVSTDSDYLGNDLKRWDFDDYDGFINLYNYDFYLATKEQRDILFQKMKEAGWEWDSEGKELIKIK